MLNKINDRIQYHKDCINDILIDNRNVWTHYESETRNGLDDFQLNVLLSWRKETMAANDALINAHNVEIEWLTGLVDV